jgi:hypothetical protein
MYSINATNIDNNYSLVKDFKIKITLLAKVDLDYY